MASSGYRVPKSQVEAVCCHRKRGDKEQYLVRWKSHNINNPANAVLSWHPVDELTSVLPLVQVYVNNFVDARGWKNAGDGGLNVPSDSKSKSLKRKSPHDRVSSAPSSSSSPASLSSSTSSQQDLHEVWNGRLIKRAGIVFGQEVTPAQDKKNAFIRVDATTMPTVEMLTEAASLSERSVHEARIKIFRAFEYQLSRLPGPPVTIINNVDKETPSLSFTWIADYVLGEGVKKIDSDFQVGCSKCRPDMGQGIGCEYTQLCDCLELAAPDNSRLKTEVDYKRYAAWESGEGDASGLPKRFPYLRTGMLNGFYLQSRNVVYECNKSCNCGPICKNKLVQWGRKVPLEVFKTKKRGFGLRCPQPLKRGQFIDKYLGELITDAEADNREKSAGPGRASYLFWLDKHADDSGEDPSRPARAECYVADGERMGGPTRFINHSCNPNCRLFTVSYNKFDLKVYDLAFFALYDIAANEELTFDYKDPEEGEAGLAQEVDEEDQGLQAVPCLCGAENCRETLWM